MTDGTAPARRTIAVFADRDDSEHAALYRRVAATFAKAEVNILIMANGTADRLVETFSAVPGTRVDVLETADEKPLARRLELARRADALVGLPARIGPVSDLYMTWVAGRDHNGVLLPVGLLNQKKAFEVVRGFMGDVAGVGLGRTDHLVQFSDTIEDLLARVLRLEPVKAESGGSAA